MQYLYFYGFMHVVCWYKRYIIIDLSKGKSKEIFILDTIDGITKKS